MEAWTQRVIRHRRVVLAVWLVLCIAGVLGQANLDGLLSYRFSVPGSDAELGRTLLKQHFGDRSAQSFTLVVKTAKATARTHRIRAAVAASAATASRAVTGGQAGPVQIAARDVAYVEISTPLDDAEAASQTPAIRAAIAPIVGARTFLSGFPAINYDTQRIYSTDLTKGESVAIPIALLVLAFMFGTLSAIGVPLAFAAVTIPATLGTIWLIAHILAMAAYVTNIVTLIGFAIAVDYSLLVVYRFREELERHDTTEGALVATMCTAGRATLFSGVAVALGLSLLALMPLPFMRSLGIGGLLVPLVSIVSAATFLPALLAVLGRNINRFRVVPRRLLASRAQARAGGWTRLSRSIMRTPTRYLVGAAGVMIALALPATQLQLNGGDNRSIPRTTDSTLGLSLLERSLGPGSLAPHVIMIDTKVKGGALRLVTVEAELRLLALLRQDADVKQSSIAAPVLLPQTATGLSAARRDNLIDSAGQVLQIRVAGRGDAGTTTAVNLVHRIRDHYIPAAGFGSSTVVLTGAPAFGVDFISRAYGAFPWLVLSVLAVTSLLLLCAFRSLVLPAKAVLMNLLSVSAAYGVLVLAFQTDLHSVLGLQGSPQIEAWIPIFLFAMLFGLSMDYEVFLLSRMREYWDVTRDNTYAVSHGLEATAGIITAAAIIMIAAFAGFTTGSFVGLQQLGVGLAAAIFFDVTLVRALIVPAMMQLFGDWNWYLPACISRMLPRQR